MSCGCEALIKAIDAYIAKEDGNLSNELKDAGFAEPKETVEGASSLEDKITDALEKEKKYYANKAKNHINLKEYAKAFPDYSEGDKTNEELARLFFKDFNENIPKLTAAYLSAVDPELKVGAITERTTEWAKSWSEELGKRMKLDTHKEIEKLLTDNLENGKSVADFTQALIEGGIRTERSRARAAALTETLRAHSVAQQEALIQNPAVEGKQWIHTGAYRNKPRENHVAMDGVIVPKGEPFTLDGADGETYYPMYPRDPLLPPGESVNCHCIHRGVVNEDILGLSLEERERLQQEAIDELDEDWEAELDAQNRAKAGISV